MSRAIRGDIQDIKQIKLGSGRCFQGQTDSVVFDGTVKFNTATPAANWRDLGVLMNNVTLNLQAGEFAFKTGVPSVRKKTYIVSRDGSLQVEFEEFSALLSQIAMGLNSPVNKLTGSEMTVTSYSSVTKILVVNSTAGLLVGDELVFDTASGVYPTSNNKGLISTVDSGTQVTLRGDGFYKPVDNTYVGKKVVSTKLAFGGSNVKTYPFLFVIDILDPAGVTTPKQIVYFFPKVSAQGNYSPALGGGSKNMTNQITFEAYGIIDTDLADIMLAACYVFESEA